MKTKIAFLVILFSQFQSAFPKIVPIIEENYEDCTSGGSAQVLDISNLKLVRKNDNYFINGKALYKINEEKK